MLTCTLERSGTLEVQVLVSQSSDSLRPHGL